MTLRNETLRTVERFSGREEKVESVRHKLDTQSVERLLMRQAEMLLAVERDVSSAVFGVLYAKIEHEHSSLLGMIASDLKASQEKERLNRTLPADYFIRKRLDEGLI